MELSATLKSPCCRSRAGRQQAVTVAAGGHFLPARGTGRGAEGTGAAGSDAGPGPAWMEVIAPAGGRCLHRLGPGEMVLGRDSGCCDIVVAGKTVSRRHALVRPAGAGFEIIDLDSTNGTRVNGRRIHDRRLLADGDLVGLGSGDQVQLRFHGQRPGSRVRTFRLPAGKTWTIGRDRGCDIVLEPAPTVSGCHATLRRQGDHLLLCDRQSRNGTWLNGRPVRRARLEPEDTVVIGFCQLRLRLARDGSLEVRLRDRSSSIRLECVGLCSRRPAGREQRQILHDITLAIEPGEFVGILGPSGAGKTTLLKALNGYAPAEQGTVLLDESPLYRAHAMFRHCLGYVPQDDLLLSELTVARSLEYIARLRLPGDVGAAERRQIVDRILALLDLDHVRNQRIASLSGGQRRRVAIGGELVTGPAILFLDEPTAGLDPGIEARLMRHFRTLADRGTTVLITTHLLSSLELLDRVIILARGELVFFGPPAEAVEFFSSPSAPLAGPAGIFSVLLGHQGGPGTGKGKGSQEEIARVFAARFRASRQWQDNVIHRLSSAAADLLAAETAAEPGDRTGGAAARPRFGFGAGQWRFFRPGPLRVPGALATLCRRQLRVRFSGRRRLPGLCIPILLALVTMSLPVPGLAPDPGRDMEQLLLARRIAAAGPDFARNLKMVLLPDGRSDPRSALEIVRQVRYQNGANLPVPGSVLLMSVMTALFLGTMSGCLEIAPERMLFRRERMAGMVIPDYLGAKMVSCMLLTAGQCLLFVACWLLHPQLRQLPLVPVWLTMVSAAWCSVALGLAISALDPASGRFSVLLAIGAVLPQLILSGGIGPGYYRDMAPSLQRLADLLPARWALAMQFAAVYHGQATPAWVAGFIRDRVGFDSGMEQWYYGLCMLALQGAGWLLFCAWLLKRRDPIP